VISFIRPTVEHLSDNEKVRLDTRPYTTGYFEDLISQVKQWAHWIEVREFLSSQPKTRPVTATYTPVQGQQHATKDFKAPAVESPSQKFDHLLEGARFICTEPILRSWVGDRPVTPLSECEQCLTRYPWESLDAARYHLRTKHFAADAKPGPLSVWIKTIKGSNDGGTVASTIPQLSTRSVIGAST